ncbi:MAG: AAA family ATPase [bacterium]|nr:AAA family ATPase [bacterium]
MIKQLILENVSFIDNASIEFSPKFNVITGETGAGKTMLVSTLLTLTGERVEIELLDKTKTGSIVGIFELSDAILEELRSIEIDAENPVIIRRSFRKDGRSSTYLNDVPVSGQILKKVGALLFDIHGQHEHQLLLKREYHIKVIDIMAGNDELISEFKAIHSEFRALSEKLEDATKKMEEAQREREMLEYTDRELSEAGLNGINEDELVNSLREMESSEEIKESISMALALFSSDENPSLNGFLASLKKHLSETAKRTKRADVLLNQLSDITSLSTDLERDLESLSESIVYDEEILASSRKVYDNLERLKKKYRCDLNELQLLAEKTKDQLKMIENPSLTLSLIKESMNEALQRLSETAAKLHERRTRVSSIFEKRVNKTLKNLNMADSEVRVRIDYSEDTVFDNGYDSLEIYLSNRFSPEGMPLRKIASGGEISRVMLAVKSALNESDPVGTMIFDEIDQGISGETAVMVADSMSSASKNRQIIAITHLPQIAAKGERHILVQKKKKSISAEVIENNDRVKEIGRLLGSSLSPETAEKHARALLDK